MKKKKATEKDKKKVLSFFLLGFPTLIIITLMMLIPDAWYVAILIAVYQFITLKQFIDQYYEEY